MSTRTQTHATFVLEREYQASPAQVWAAFADPERKAQWFGGEEFSDVEVSLDFRVGGTEINDGRIGDGPLSRFRAVYTDIVAEERIVYSYDMWLDDTHASTSITTIVLTATDGGTLLTFTEQGVHLDGVHGPGAEAAAGREEGTQQLLEQLARMLAA